jgi:hypothetical protein
MRRTALEAFFDHDSVLIRNFVEIKWKTLPNTADSLWRVDHC